MEPLTYLTTDQLNALTVIAETCKKSDNCFSCNLHPVCGQFRLIAEPLDEYRKQHNKSGKIIT